MTCERALHLLREHKAELNASGVVHLRIFGSVARNEANEHSDVDILADFDPNHSAGMFRAGGLQQDLCRILGASVDLSSEPWLKSTIREQVLKECIFAF